MLYCSFFIRPVLVLMFAAVSGRSDASVSADTKQGGQSSCSAGAAYLHCRQTKVYPWYWNENPPMIVAQLSTCPDT